MTDPPSNRFDIRLKDLKILILDNIKESPGIRYRELQRLSGLTNGALEYNIKILEKTKKIKVDRQYGRRPRYYLPNTRREERYIISNIRNISSRQIVLFILEHKLCTFGEILEHMKKARSTISWHIKRLLESGVISIVSGQDLQLYKISNTQVLTDILYRYKDTFRYNVTNEYYETFWTSLISSKPT